MPSPDHPPAKKSPADRLGPEKYARLKAEAKAPYRGLRQFVYLSCAASGLIGGFIFLMQVLAGRDVATALPNLGVQVAVVTLMVWLFRLEQRASQKDQD